MSDEETFDYEVPQVKWEPITRKVEREDEETGKVVVEQEVTGHRVVPNYDGSWDELVKLRWFAALIGNRTGVQVRVAQSPRETEIINTDFGDEKFFKPYTYLVSTQHLESQDPAPYEVTWAWLSGLETGILEGRFPVDGQTPAS